MDPTSKWFQNVHTTFCNHCLPWRMCVNHHSFAIFTNSSTQNFNQRFKYFQHFTNGHVCHICLSKTSIQNRKLYNSGTVEIVFVLMQLGLAFYIFDTSGKLLLAFWSVCIMAFLYKNYTCLYGNLNLHNYLSTFLYLVST